MSLFDSVTSFSCVLLSEDYSSARGDRGMRVRASHLCWRSRQFRRWQLWLRRDLHHAVCERDWTAIPPQLAASFVSLERRRVARPAESRLIDR
jgi:hypothetical protein